MDRKDFELSRRQLLKWGLMSGAGAMIGGGILSNSVFGQLPLPNENCNPRKEPFPISPFILTPFAEDNPVPIPLTMATGWRQVDGSLGEAPLPEWFVRRAAFLDRNLGTSGVVVP